MASTTKDRVTGRQCAVVASKLATGATPLTKWTKFGAEVEMAEDEASAASAPMDQFSDGRKKATFTFEGFIGSSESLPDLPRVGDIIKTLGVQTITEGADLLYDFSDETVWGKIKVTKINYEQTDKPGTYSFTARTGGFAN